MSPMMRSNCRKGGGIGPTLAVNGRGGLGGVQVKINNVGKIGRGMVTRRGGALETTMGVRTGHLTGPLSRVVRGLWETAEHETEETEVLKGMEVEIMEHRDKSEELDPGTA